MRFAKSIFFKAVLVCCFPALLAACSQLKQKPLNELQVDLYTSTLQAKLDTVSPPVQGLLSYQDALQRAVLFNLDVKLKEREAGFASIESEIANGAMLPNLVARSDYFARDRLAYSRSNLSNTYSTSSHLNGVSNELSLSFSVLDFGLSYFRAKQSADRSFQKGEDVRLMRARIAEQTSLNFWRAVALENLQAKTPALEHEISEALRLSDMAAQDSRVDPAMAMDNQKQILSLQRGFSQYGMALAGTKDQLKLLIGLPQAASLQLDHRQKNLDFTNLNLNDAQADLTEALRKRPEIRQVMYDQHITETETYARLVQLLPGIQTNYTFNGDNNAYLLNNNWVSWGASLSGNLINLLRLPANLKAVDGQQELNRQIALTTAASIAMQVHVTRAKFQALLYEYELSRKIAANQRIILAQTGINVKIGRNAEQDLLKEKIQALQADIKVQMDYAEVIAAYVSYLTAKGVAPE